MTESIVIIENNYFFRFFCLVFAISLFGIFLVNFISAIIDKFGYRGINIFYRRKADEQDIKIEIIEEQMRINNRHNTEIDSILIDIKNNQQKIEEYINQLNDKINKK